MPLRLYADECVDARIVAGLRRRSVDVVTVADEGLLGASDERQLASAIELQRVVVTSDQDFLRLARASLQTTAHFPGAIFILPATPVGNVVRAVAFIAIAFDAADMVDWIEWVP